MHNENQQLLIILFIVFISFIGTSMAYPLFPPLFLHPAQNSIIPFDWSHTTRSFYLGIALAAYPLGQFLGSPVLGGCSDRYGRKKILILSLIGSVIGYLFSALALTYHILWVLLVSRFFTGFMEGNLAIVRAMAIDLQTISKYKSLGRINSASGIAYVLGPLLSGALSDNTLLPWLSYSFPFWAAVIFSGITTIFAAIKLNNNQQVFSSDIVSIWQRFNLIKRYHSIFKTSQTLKYLLIISSLFTFATDIFYEFGPVYLTASWGLTSAGIAVYNGILSLTLAIGSGLLPHYLSFYFSIRFIIPTAFVITSLLFGLMALWPTLIFAFILFGLVGLSISTGTTSITIQISNTADRSIQGEAMGAQLSIRTLGDALLCFVGGFVIMSSVIAPIAISSCIALLAALFYIVRLMK